MNVTYSSQLEQVETALKNDPNLPKHIAIIMDGNGRWAKKRGLPRIAGHNAGIESVRHVVEACAHLGLVGQWDVGISGRTHDGSLLVA